MLRWGDLTRNCTPKATKLRFLWKWGYVGDPPRDVGVYEGVGGGSLLQGVREHLERLPYNM